MGLKLNDDATQLVRLPNWERSLDRFVRSCVSKDFEWGVYDCGTFAISAVRAMTGVDLRRVCPWLGWSDRKSALRMLSFYGGIEAIMARFFLIGGSSAKGNLGIFRTGEDRLSIGVSIGNVSAMPGAHGLEEKGNFEAMRFWEVRG